MATVEVRSLTAEFDNKAVNVACDELNDLRAIDVLSAVVKYAFDSFPEVSTNKTVVGWIPARIDDKTDDNDDNVVVPDGNCGFFNWKKKNTKN